MNTFRPRPCTRPVAAPGINTQLERRRTAAHRSVPLDCGCRDPHPCRCTEPPLSDHALDGWKAAALHVIAVGEIPVLPIEVRRALWRRNRGDDRATAERLHSLVNGEVA